MGICHVFCQSPTCWQNGCTNAQQWAKDKASQPKKEEKPKKK